MLETFFRIRIEVTLQMLSVKKLDLFLFIGFNSLGISERFEHEHWEL